MTELTAFKPGDWIIASRPKVWMDSTGMFGMGQLVERRDNSYSSEPIKVIAVTEAHIVYETYYGMGPSKHVMPFSTLEEFGFIIAAPELVAVVTEKYHPKDKP